MGFFFKENHFALTIASEHFLVGGRGRTALCSSFSVASLLRWLLMRGASSAKKAAFNFYGKMDHKSLV